MKEYLARVAEAIRCVDVGELDNSAKIIKHAQINGNTVWIVGNGGSAATAEHFAGDLIKMAGVRAIAVPSLTAAMLAYGNDNGWKNMFSDLLNAMGRDGDVLVAISCSGRSENVVRAAGDFHHNRLIVLTGDKYETDLAVMDADAKIFAKDPDIRVQEDVHMAVCHAIAGALK